MPRRKATWSAWNYLTSTRTAATRTVTSAESSSGGSTETDVPPQRGAPGSAQTVSLTYNMNILQSISTAAFGDVLVTMNPPHPPAAARTQAVFQYRHPLYTARTVAAQDALEAQLQGRSISGGGGGGGGGGGVWYAGAWTGYGFHEDGFASGMRVGLRLGGDVEWDVADAKFARGVVPKVTMKDRLLRAVIFVVHIWILGLESAWCMVMTIVNGLLRGRIMWPKEKPKAS